MQASELPPKEWCFPTFKFPPCHVGNRFAFFKTSGYHYEASLHGPWNSLAHHHFPSEYGFMIKPQAYIRAIEARKSIVHAIDYRTPAPSSPDASYQAQLGDVSYLQEDWLQIGPDFADFVSGLGPIAHSSFPRLPGLSGNSEDPLDIPEDPLDIPVDPLDIPVDPLDIPEDPLDIPVDPLDIPEDSFDIPDFPDVTIDSYGGEVGSQVRIYVPDFIVVKAAEDLNTSSDVALLVIELKRQKSTWSFGRCLYQLTEYLEGFKRKFPDTACKGLLVFKDKAYFLEHNGSAWAVINKRDPEESDAEKESFIGAPMGSADLHQFLRDIAFKTVISDRARPGHHRRYSF